MNEWCCGTRISAGERRLRRPIPQTVSEKVVCGTADTLYLATDA